MLFRSQLALGRERVIADGLQDKVDLQLLDYRDLPQDGRFEKLSVSVIEQLQIDLVLKTIGNNTLAPQR